MNLLHVSLLLSRQAEVGSIWISSVAQWHMLQHHSHLRLCLYCSICPSDSSPPQLPSTLVLFPSFFSSCASVIGHLNEKASN